MAHAAKVDANGNKVYGSLAKRRLSLVIPILTVMFSAMIILMQAMLRPGIAGVYVDVMDEVASARAKDVSDWLTGYLLDMRTYTTSDAALSGDDDAVMEYLHTHTNVRNSDYAYMFFAGRDGTTQRDTGLVGKPGDIANRVYYKQVMNEGAETVIADVVISTTTGKPVITVVRAAKDAQGRTYGLFAGNIGVDYMHSVIKKVHIGQGGSVMVVDGKGQIVAAPSDDDIMKLISDKNDQLAQTVKSGVAGRARYRESDGRWMRVSVAPIEVAKGWMACVIVPEDQIYAPAKKISSALITMCIIVELLLCVIIIWMVNYIMSTMNVVGLKLTEVATGEADLTARIDIARADEIGRLVDSFNMFIQKIHTIVLRIKDSQETLRSVQLALGDHVERMDSNIAAATAKINDVTAKTEEQSAGTDTTVSSVEQINRSIDSLGDMISDQTSSTTEASAAVEEMIGNIQSMDTSTSRMADEFRALTDDAQGAAKRETNVAALIRKVAEESESLRTANEVISSIAKQTNLLAMNAAIEAAHAGDAGKGFSVVADEIRKLAETSSAQSKQIGDKLSGIRSTIESVVQDSDASEKAFEGLIARLDDTEKLVEQIKEAIQEQAEGSKQVLEAMKLMSDTSLQVKSSSQEMTAGAQSITQAAENLRALSNEVKELMGGIGEGAKEISVVGSDVKDSADKLSHCVTDIENEIGLFKV